MTTFTVTVGAQSCASVLKAVCLPPPPPVWNEPPASTHRCFLCSFLLPFFSAQLGFPSRWLRAQAHLFIHSSKMLGGRAPWGSRSLPNPQGKLLAPHWLFLSAGSHFPQCITQLPAQGVDKALPVQSPLPLDNESSGGRG